MSLFFSSKNLTVSFKHFKLYTIHHRWNFEKNCIRKLGRSNRSSKRVCSSSLAFNNTEIVSFVIWPLWLITTFCKLLNCIFYRYSLYFHLFHQCTTNQLISSSHSHWQLLCFAASLRNASRLSSIPSEKYMTGWVGFCIRSMEYEYEFGRTKEVLLVTLLSLKNE